MTAFDELKRQAAAKRDAAIREARKEYRETIRSLDGLRCKLAPKKRKRSSVPLHERILQVIPTDACFTVSDLESWLGLNYSDHDLIRSTLYRMIKRGQIKRMRRSRCREVAMFASVEYGPSVSKWDDMTLVEAAETVLRELGRPISAMALGTWLRSDCRCKNDAQVVA
ncbi:MAG: hypothetical protein CMJ78_05015 [Planctomycetaceae bacterium]|nr:hypothetical protein [Planctomycetaceae bacterium]